MAHANIERREGLRAQAVALRFDGLDLREIGAKLGVSGEYVRQLLVGTEAQGVHRLWTKERAHAERLGWKVVRHTGQSLILACGVCGKERHASTTLADRCRDCLKDQHQLQVAEELRGRRFGRWTVIGSAPASISRWTYVTCRCDCGTERPVAVNNLQRGLSKGCAGCAPVGRRPKSETTQQSNKVTGQEP